MNLLMLERPELAGYRPRDSCQNAALADALAALEVQFARLAVRPAENRQGIFRMGGKSVFFCPPA